MKKVVLILICLLNTLRTTGASGAIVDSHFTPLVSIGFPKFEAARSWHMEYGLLPDAPMRVSELYRTRPLVNSTWAFNNGAVEWETRRVSYPPPAAEVKSSGTILGFAYSLHITTGIVGPPIFSASSNCGGLPEELFFQKPLPEAGAAPPTVAKDGRGFVHSSHQQSTAVSKVSASVRIPFWFPTVLFSILPISVL